MKKLAQFAVHYPITIFMLVLAVLLLGYISFGKLGIDLFPDLNNPRIFIELKVGEKPPEEIEKQFVDNIESLAIRQNDVTQVSSICRVGSAQITVEYAWNKDMDEAFLDLQKELTNYSQNADIDELNITQHDPNAAPVMIVGLTHESLTNMDELRKTAENYIRNELIRIEGIADVKLSGQEESEVIINTDNYLLEAYNLSIDDITRQIQNFNRNVSGGSIEEMGIRYVIKGVSVFDDLEDIRDIIVGYKQSDETNVFTGRVPVYLRDIARVEFRNKDPFNIVRINQERCIGLSIYKEPKFNTVKAVDELSEALTSIRKALPGYEFTVIQNQANFITSAINEVKETALFGILFAIIVIYIFLRRIGTTIIVSVAIPVSIIATFNLMYFNGLTLNIMTLGGLALGAGMLVDNAIVVVENIFRNIESGLSVKEAAIQGTAEVGGAITASTITTIVVFLPIVYLHGASGELFKDQAWTVAFSLLSSLFVAILVIPVLFNRFFKNLQYQKRTGAIQFQWYPSLLSKILKMRWLIISTAIVLVIVAFFLIPVIGSEYIPKTDSSEITVEIKLQEGTTLERTSQTVEKIENLIVSLLPDDLNTIYNHIGPSVDQSEDEESVFEDENTASVKIILEKERVNSTVNIIALINNILKDIPDLEYQFIQSESALQQILGTEEAPFVVEVRGDEFDQIENLTNQVKEKMMEMDELYNVKTSIEEGTPEVEVIVDRQQAGTYNLSADQIISQLRYQLLGADAGEFESEGEMKGIEIKLPETGISQLQYMQIKSGNQSLRLGDLAKINTIVSPKEIYRRNQNRIGRVTSQVKKGIPFDHVVHKMEEKISQIHVPLNYFVQMAGEEEKRKESMRNLTFALILSIILVYMVLASQFESLIHPFTILLTIPLAGVGAILIFFFIGKSLNIMAYIGIIMLIGIAVNDSIILVDLINQLKREGLSRLEAILKAGNYRIRPILITSLTTILALFPLTLGIGESAALRSPVALAVIGGLVTSTILTLIVIPCVYYIFDQVKER
jgi:HAE1 family hydrophobic/amphiphilic exporter-1